MNVRQSLFRHLRSPLVSASGPVENPATFREELNNQCGRIILFVALITTFAWLAYIPIDQRLYPHEPFIIVLRIGLSVVGLAILILQGFRQFDRYNLLFLCILSAYVGIATGLITGLTRADPAYLGGYLFVLTLLALVPIPLWTAWSILAVSLAAFFTTGFAGGMHFDSDRARYSLNDLLIAAFIVAFFIFLLNRLRFRSWEKSKQIGQQNETLQADKARIDDLLHDLRLSETKYRKLFDHSPTGIFLATAEGTVLAANRAMLESLKFESVDALNAAGLPNLYIDRMDQTALWERVQEGPVSGYETVLQRADGARIPVSISAFLVSDESGEAPFLEGTIEDITERRRAEEEKRESEEALRRSEEKYRLLTENSGDVIWTVDPEFRFTYVSPSIKKLRGVDPEEAVNEQAADTMSPESLEAIFSAYNRHLAEIERGGNPTVRVEVEQYRKDGSSVWVEASVRTMRDGEGRMTGFVGVSRDISERRQVEAALRDSERRLADIIDFLPIATMVIDREGRVTAWNRAMEAITGVKREDILGKSDHEYSLPFYGERRPILIDLVFTPEEELAARYSHIRREGSVLSAEAFIPNLGIILVGYASALYGIDGSIIGAIESIRDITDIRRVEEDLKEAKTVAEAANRSKSAFLANMSHEIRTPMNAILGFAQLMDRDPDLSPQSREHLDIINRSGEHLLSLINDILEMSKIEAGRATFTPNTFDLQAFLRDIERMFRIRTDAKKLSFLLEEVGPVPRWAVTDEGKLRQVLINLMGNAVKFTEEGGIALRIASRAGKKGTVNLRFEVEDTGPGMTEEEKGLLFQAFEQTRAGVKSGGTGLGLALSRGFIQVMGGSIAVTSTVGKGTTFRFEIPVREGTEEQVRPKEVKRRILRLKPGQGEIRVLVADDRDTNRRLLSQLLGPVGFDTREAGDGEEALRAIREWKPRVVLMDMTMPVMDGYEATRIIKATPELKDTTVIAVTASAFEEDRQRIFAAGADGYLSKPFKEEELFENIRRLTGTEFLYDETGAIESTQCETGDSGEMRRVVAALAPELVSRMRDAVESADTDLLNELVSRVAPDHPALARHLREMAARYEYDTLIELFSPGA